ncbi:MAG: preprotein translocase subunit SecG [Candidatus Obscuribacter sp.]|jgi:preprotein translocase subunit SecG|nr:preprotein translocase subunit SecG [Candidatus Obscuribacter sp.]MDQ5965876.1 preprotein translocase subunit SecG [Cyanobacteriota bacterium erpe_2018_sw_39hr_WHONDRS-SW48-000098_B_bin.30]MBK7836570.1 preprotein translocase subunit SecG [Candidatus Obscuribacter sp.]MBK9204141.1 preprotein translocase subunit SecG [Candidatus Obscuribacter sp.]MBK9617603.1 preprotein translocase subunit SecG [Candidatus Obscuribacter sp.]
MSAAYIALLVIGAVLAVALIGLILLHAPKGDGMAGIGSAATVFSGKRGAEAGLDRLTWTVFALFMLDCTVVGFGFVK